MAKKSLFKNYVFEFDKNEIKILSNFCKQVVSQMQGSEKNSAYINIFNSILDKLHGNDEKVKFTKQERTMLESQMRENIKYLNEKINNSWILKKWLFKSIRTQYQLIIDKHFND